MKRANSALRESKKTGFSLLQLFFCIALVALIGFGVFTVFKTRNNFFARDVLVLYAFSNTNPEYINNLRFFIREAIERDPNSEYKIIVQGSHVGVELPKLPPHASYIFHKNECYDWGTFGWALKQVLKIRKYSYYFFVNCSVRGPFMPSYVRNTIRWTEPFIQMLDSNVKLVGPAINCEGTSLIRESSAPWRANPHVQSYAIATDQEGLDILLDAKHVFHCHTTRLGTIFYSELGASQAILNAGYNIGSFMAKYRDVDWRDPLTWNCNRRSSPVSDHYDGYSLDPFEAMFVKYKDRMSTYSKTKAQRYSEWLSPGYSSNLSNINSTAFSEADSNVRFMLLTESFGRQCFDDDFYLKNNPDLVGLEDAKDTVWKHFVYFGQFEKRMFRMKCSLAQLTQRLFRGCYTCAISDAWLPADVERPKPFSTRYKFSFAPVGADSRTAVEGKKAF
eukprot:CAMPEP_0175041996 /NCGR_PEP_ID=MMETSP0052_2-20121109/2277_1 /TAXON_ID=51329 ORGANISM="Polytomella parva, Strain SAG 63-3" /NCGR_SAMPLE_ID=MMETSP0052_2 /ASSEMBLY_ACC=CAM_ASM_000194 /LENGTH=447 /DNA_ID=CAMNT_0016304677 /DNA_START=295 /DNA_END=1638 /DNA_ORIENTATION=-